MKVLITGIAGQIGSQLARQCLEEGWEVAGIDNLSTGTLENIKDIENKISFHRLSLQKMEYFKEENFDYIFHLGALADIVPSIENPKEYFDSNVRGTFELMEYCRKIKPKKIIYSASSSCYGIPEIYPTSETSKINCEYPYAWTKNSAKELIEHYGKVYGVKYINLVLFNIYGKAKTGTAYNAVLNILAKQYLEKTPFTIVGDGEQKRDFLRVEDCARAFILAAKSEIVNENINIGAGKPQSINYLCELLGGKDYPKDYMPKRPGEPDCTCADISKAKKILGWEPKISFEEGIQMIKKDISQFKTCKLWDKDSISRAISVWFDTLNK